MSVAHPGRRPAEALKWRSGRLTPAGSVYDAVSLGVSSTSGCSGRRPAAQRWGLLGSALSNAGAASRGWAANQAA